jgi:ankyrin repeat protein
VLVQNGANIYAVNNFGHSVLHIAAVNDNQQILKYFFRLDNKTKMFTVDQLTNEEKQTPLHYACRTGSINAVNVLVTKYKADIEARDYQGRSPLYIASEYGNASTVRELIDLGAQLDVENVYGQKALFWICSKSPDLALDVLDNYQKFDAYSRKNEFKLNKVDLKLFEDENGNKIIPKTKSIVRQIKKHF